jgi:hypothetical protein
MGFPIIDIRTIILIGGFALEAAALGMTDGVDRRQYVVYGTIVFAGAVALAAMGSTPNGRVVAATAPAAAVYAALGFFMLKKGCSRLRAFIAIVAFLFAGVLSIRSIAAAVDRSFSLFSPAVIQTLSFMPLLVFLILGAVGFFFLLKERDDRLLRENEEKYRTVAEKATEAIVIENYRRRLKGDAGAHHRHRRAEAAPGTRRAAPARSEPPREEQPQRRRIASFPAVRRRRGKIGRRRPPRR